MAGAVITLRVLRKGRRTDEILEAVGKALDEHLEPDQLGAVHIAVGGRAARAWDEIRDALDGAGDDWRQWLHLAPRPAR